MAHPKKLIASEVRALADSTRTAAVLAEAFEHHGGYTFDVEHGTGQPGCRIADTTYLSVRRGDLIIACYACDAAGDYRCVSRYVHFWAPGIPDAGSAAAAELATYQRAAARKLRIGHEHLVERTT